MSVLIGEQSHLDWFIHGCNMSTHPTRVLKTTEQVSRDGRSSDVRASMDTQRRARSQNCASQPHPLLRSHSRAVKIHLHGPSPREPDGTVQQFPRAALRKYYKPVGINIRNLPSHSCENYKSKVKVLAGLVPPKSCEEESVPGLSPGFQWSPAIFGIPWLVDVSPNLCLPLHMAVTLCVHSVFEFPLFNKDTSLIGIEAHLNPA